MGWGVARHVVAVQGGFINVDGRASEQHTMIVMQSERSGGEELITICCEALEGGGQVLLRLFIVVLDKVPD